MKHTIELYKQGRYNIISERMIEVDSQTVTKQIKKGREIITCSCENAGRFASNQLCRHKQFFILLPFFQLIEKKARNMLNYYKPAKDITKNPKEKEIYNQVIDDLTKFKEIDFR
jgi:hypothetical protein